MSGRRWLGAGAIAGAVAAGVGLVAALTGSEPLSVGRCTGSATEASVARVWNEQVLDAIRRDEPAPTVHARNLYHLSAAMWDAWVAFDPSGTALFAHPSPAGGGPAAAGPSAERGSAADGLSAAEIDQARADAISHAAATVLRHRYRDAVGSAATADALDRAMIELCGMPVDEALADLPPRSASELGATIGRAVLDASVDDGSREQLWYEDVDYAPVNPPLVVDRPGTELVDPNRWQPLELEQAVAQNGLPLPAGTQTFIGSQWGRVEGFALPPSAADGLPLDPGSPPLLGADPESAAEFQAGVLTVLRASSELETGAATIDLSPGVRGNSGLGRDDGTGHGSNPVTGQPYPSNRADAGDYHRVIAEFWADGPDSETPPGHWNTLANHASDAREHQDAEGIDGAVGLRVGGKGEAVDRLEWDVKLYLALNGALHDAAVAGWGAKAHYDYIRPISMIRHLGGLGQSSDPEQSSFHPEGLPLEDGLVELVTAESAASGGRHEHLARHVGEIAVRAWRGSPSDPEVETSGVGWIRAVEWTPYQRPTFVTPAFAAYVSGHSTFSRAGADVLTAFTGSPYFPGGLAEHTVEAGALLHEEGPTETVTLQWASYGDAADEAGRSRIWGGIHVPADDIAGRLMGARCAELAWARAQELFGL